MRFAASVAVVASAIWLDTKIGLREQHRTAKTTGTMPASTPHNARMLLAHGPLTRHIVAQVQAEPIWSRIAPDVNNEQDTYVLVFKPCSDAPWRSDQLDDKESVKAVFEELLGGGVTVTLREWDMNGDRKERPMGLSGGSTEITYVRIPVLGPPEVPCHSVFTCRQFLRGFFKVAIYVRTHVFPYIVGALGMYVKLTSFSYGRR